MDAPDVSMIIAVTLVMSDSIVLVALGKHIFPVLFAMVRLMCHSVASNVSEE